MSGRGTDILLGGDPTFLAIEQLKTWLYLNLKKKDASKSTNELLHITNNDEMIRKWKTTKYLYPDINLNKSFELFPKHYCNNPKLLKLKNFLTQIKLILISNTKITPTNDQINMLIKKVAKSKNFISIKAKNKRTMFDELEIGGEIILVPKIKIKIHEIEDLLGIKPSLTDYLIFEKLFKAPLLIQLFSIIVYI